MDAISTILKTVQTAAKAMRFTAVARSAIFACATLVCCAAWRAWRS
ncbi:MAG: hypothetical protein IKD72_08365 [Clostridia bacterium]|nr:hypothetical protein [Clostridia bacterium]